MAEEGGKLDDSEGSNANAPPSESTITSDDGKKRKVVRARSVVWEHFEKYDDSDRAPRARCKYCSSNYAANTSYNDTSTLSAHLRKCKQNPHNVETSQAKIGFQQASKDHKSDVSMRIWRFDQELCRKALAKMIIVDELPFSFVEKRGFRYFVSVARPQFRIPSRTIVTRDCFELFYEENQKLKNFLRENNQIVCNYIYMDFNPKN
ncbi:zinc finger BED domain-containing protein RICESLEEPER 4-like [Primulina eburnea]|uniref:zinc finger BED domain-containing protein RICESLEEPER 4-like n=1 Tax=Primulina eburnea TaxID=1245227 RepID=UPI003C6C4AB3